MIETDILKYLKKDDGHTMPITVVKEKLCDNEYDLTVTISEITPDEINYIKDKGFLICCHGQCVWLAKDRKTSQRVTQCSC